MKFVLVFFVVVKVCGLSMVLVLICRCGCFLLRCWMVVSLCVVCRVIFRVVRLLVVRVLVIGRMFVLWLMVIIGRMCVFWYSVLMWVVFCLRLCMVIVLLFRGINGLLVVCGGRCELVFVVCF